MGIKKVEHIAIAVKDLKSSIETFEKLLGVKCYLIEEVTDQKVKTAFFKVGETKIELLEATTPDSTIAKFIEKKGEGLHHIAFETDDISAELKRVEANGFRLIDEKPRKGAEELDIAFVHPKSVNGTLVELCSSESKNNKI